MPHHGNDAEHEETQSGEQPGEANEQQATPQGVEPEGDALAQAEEILNSAESDEAEDSAEPAAGDEAQELRADLQRLQAEYVNYRKRVERDRAVAGENATISVMNSLLPVLDDIAAAKAHGDLEDGPFAAIATKLNSALSGLGLEVIEETGVAFDPMIHEALLQQPDPEIAADHVMQILRPGYRKGERVLRAAQVIVSTGQ